jgi:hypothetical protein
MNSKKNILTFILFGLYCFVFLHSIVPHTHHSSGQIESPLGPQSAKATNKFSFFDNLLHNHEHQEDNHELYDEYTNESEVEDISINNVKQICLTINDSVLLDTEEVFLSNKNFFYQGKTLSSQKYRGPPVFKA